MKEKLVVVGNGMAGMRTLGELLKLAPDKYEITVFGAEPHPNYNRILLSPVLTGEKQFGEIVLNDDSWYVEHGITLHKGNEVVRIDRKARKVVARDGIEASYDRLLIATGSNPFLLPVPGKDRMGPCWPMNPSPTRPARRSSDRAMVRGSPGRGSSTAAAGWPPTRVTASLTATAPAMCS